MDYTGTIWTDAGMFALWDQASFRQVVDYDTWRPKLEEDEDIGRHIAAGSFVPINVGSDGAVKVTVRVGGAAEPPELTARERNYLLVSSEPYLLVSSGAAWISGIEHVDATPNQGVHVAVAQGRWSVQVSVIDWVEEPGSEDAEGRPTADALADFVVLLAPEQRATWPVPDQARNLRLEPLPATDADP